MERIDWNNYTLMSLESQRIGIGEQGLPVTLEMSPEERNASHFLFQRHRLNAFLSARISLERSIGDHRYESCKKRLFLKNIPLNSVSIVIPFHNEHNSTILRTVHSVINKSPSNILKEVIVVDDASTYDYLREPLEDYIDKHFNKVKLIRNKQRLGLMSTRVAGADRSTGSFLVFLDAHIEVNYNFLPPLLEPIMTDYRTITIPMIDGIDGDKDFKYTEFGPDRGAFDWSLFYQRFPLLEKDREDITQPREVPTMLGCAFAISRRWWEEIGKFDSGLRVWGGEQYEISFKTWQCGGRMLDVPCSRIGHVFRKKLPYKTGQEVGRNFLRVASVWMDEYKQYLLQRMPKFRNQDPGDIGEQFEIRERLNCKPFRWYMTHVAPDILSNYPLIDPPRPAFGILQSLANKTVCLVIKNKDDSDFFSVWLDTCKHENNTVVEYSWRQQIRTSVGGKCLVPILGRLRGSRCSINGTRQKFAWNRRTGWLVNLDSGRCLHADLILRRVSMKPCSEHNLTMSWTFLGGFINQTLVDTYWDKSRNFLIDSKKWSTRR